MLTKDDLICIKILLDEQSGRIDERFTALEGNLEKLSARTDERFTALEENLQQVRDYMHKKFALVENDVIPKISALFDARDLCVQHLEYRKRDEEIARKIAYIDPLVQKVKEHSQRLEQHDAALTRLMNA